MDISFDIINNKGDLIRVALSYYDSENLHVLTSDPHALSLTFYDVTLIRLAGSDVIGVRALMAVCDVLYRFMTDNDKAVLCFYCDDQSEISRRDLSLSPQEYRSLLFSKMFEKYVALNKITGIINHQIKIEGDTSTRYVHFILPEKYLTPIKLIENSVMEK